METKPDALDVAVFRTFMVRLVTIQKQFDQKYQEDVYFH